jgi:hypothetical protein
MFKKLGSFFNDHNSSKNSKIKRQGLRGHNQIFDFLDLVRGWEKIVGPKLSKTTIPLKNQYGNLTVLTNEPAISHTLSFLEEDIKKNIFKEFPPLKGKVNRIFYQANSAFFEKKLEEVLKREKIGKPFFHPYDPKHIKLKQEAENTFKDIKDGEVRNLLISLFIQNAYYQ